MAHQLQVNIRSPGTHWAIEQLNTNPGRDAKFERLRQNAAEGKNFFLDLSLPLGYRTLSVFRKTMEDNTGEHACIWEKLHDAELNYLRHCSKSYHLLAREHGNVGKGGLLSNCQSRHHPGTDVGARNVTPSTVNHPKGSTSFKRILT